MLLLVMPTPPCSRQTLHLLFGPPASGKSTLAASLGAGVVSRDAVRTELRQRHPSVLEEQVWQEVLNRVAHQLLTGSDAALDATLSNPHRRHEAALLGKVLGATVCLYRPTVTLAECLRRNRRRTGEAQVPKEDVVRLYATCQAANIAQGQDYLDKVIPF